MYLLHRGKANVGIVPELLGRELETDAIALHRVKNHLCEACVDEIQYNITHDEKGKYEESEEHTRTLTEYSTEKER